MFILYFLAFVLVLVGLAYVVNKVETGVANRSLTRTYLRLRAWVNAHYKLVGLAAMVGFWFAFPSLLKLVTNGNSEPITMDGGVFQTLPLATIRGLALYLFVKLFLNREVKAVYSYFTSGCFVRDFQHKLTPWQKQVLTAIWLLGSLYCFSQLTR